MKQKKKSIIILALVFLIVILTMIMMFLLGKALFQNTLEEQFVTIIFLIALIGLLAYILNQLIEKAKKNLKDEITLPNDLVTNETTGLQTSTDPVNLSATKQKQTPSLKKAAPFIVLSIVFIVFFMNQMGVSLFNTSIVGRFQYEMAEGTIIGGVVNQTDYWYMDFSEDGTVDVGWKNIGFAEDSQGNGTWEKLGVEYVVTINYDYGETVVLYLEIHGKTLYDANTNITTNYIKISN